MNIFKKIVLANGLATKYVLFCGIFLLSTYNGNFAFSAENIVDDINESSMHLDSHIYLMGKSEKVLDSSLLLVRSLRYMYSKNSPIEKKYSDIYLLEKGNKFFTFNAIKNNENMNGNFSESAQSLVKLKDIEIFSQRDIVEELDIIGEDYEKRDIYITEYLELGTLLEKGSSNDIVYLKNLSKALDLEISDLKKQNKDLFNEYKTALKDKNIQQIEIIKKDIERVSAELTPKEIEKLTSSFLLKELSKVNTVVQKRINAVNENRDALVKNVKIKLDSAKYINIIEK